MHASIYFLTLATLWCLLWKITSNGTSNHWHNVEIMEDKHSMFMWLWRLYKCWYMKQSFTSRWSFETKLVRKRLNLKCGERFSKILRSSHQICSIRKGVLKNLSKFTQKHLCRNFFFIKLQASPSDCFLILAKYFLIKIE